MRLPAAAFLLLAATAAADAQTGGLAPGSTVTCPIGTTPVYDQSGTRICESTSQKPMQQGLELPPAPQPKHRRFEVSKKCPECK